MRFTDLSYDRVRRALEKLGFRLIREGKHAGFSDGKRFIVIPRHSRLNPVTITRTLRRSGISFDEFEAAL